MKKRKKSKNSKRTDIVLEEHIVKLIEKQNKQVIKNSIDAVVKRLKKKQVKSKRIKVKAKSKTKDVYSGVNGKSDEYRGLQGSGVYDQIKFSPFTGFLYKSNIKDNNKFYEHLEYSTAKHKRDELGEGNIASSEMMKNYARKTSLNFLMGEAMMGIGSVNDISVEEKELMKFNLYDRAQKAVYLAEIETLGFGREKTMNAPLLDKAA